MHLSGATAAGNWVAAVACVVDRYKVNLIGPGTIEGA